MFLTLLGGGAFGNRPIWIASAIKKALHKYRFAPLDVKLVHRSVNLNDAYRNLFDAAAATTTTATTAAAVASKSKSNSNNTDSTATTTLTNM